MLSGFRSKYFLECQESDFHVNNKSSYQRHVGYQIREMHSNNSCIFFILIPKRDEMEFCINKNTTTQERQEDY